MSDKWRSDILGEAAQGLASRSLYVFPLSPRSKEPLQGSKGFHDASIDQKRVANWWLDNPNYNIGIATGRSELVVVDIDPKHDGFNSWDKIRKQVGIDYETLTTLTGSGGEHVWFRRGKYNIGSSANSFGDAYPGVDIRGAGGYVVAPPSIHPNGKPYCFDVASDSIATIPESLEEFLKQQRFQSPTAPLRARAMIPNGKRNTTLTRIAGKLRHMGMESDEALEVLSVINRTRVQPPLDGREVGGIVRSVFRMPVKPGLEPQSLVEEEIARVFNIIAAVDIRAKRTEWLLDHRVPAGEVTIFEGRGGLGKSTVALDLLARASSGRKLPGNVLAAPPRKALVFGDEDAHALIKARLQVAGADLTKVFIVDGVGEGYERRRFQMPQDFRMLEDAIIGYSAEIVYIDSLFNAFGPGYNQNDALDVRRVLGGLADIAHRTGASIIATRHWGKADRHAKDKGLGSVEITDVARSVVSFDEGTFFPREMAVVKHNYGQEVGPLGYDFESVDCTDDFGNPMQVARVRWAPESLPEPVQTAFHETNAPVDTVAQALLDHLATSGLV